MFKFLCETQAQLHDQQLATTSVRSHVALEARFSKPCFDEFCFFNSSHTLLQGSSSVERAMDSENASTGEAWSKVDSFVLMHVSAVDCC